MGARPLGIAPHPGVPKQVMADRDMAAKATVYGLGHKIVLGVARSLIVGEDRLGAQVWPLHIRQLQRPASFEGHEAVGKPAPAGDPGEGFLKRWNDLPFGRKIAVNIVD
jgi:hypothetical protein